MGIFWPLNRGSSLIPRDHGTQNYVELLAGFPPTALRRRLLWRLGWSRIGGSVMAHDFLVADPQRKRITTIMALAPIKNHKITIWDTIIELWYKPCHVFFLKSFHQPVLGPCHDRRLHRGGPAMVRGEFLRPRAASGRASRAPRSRGKCPEISWRWDQMGRLVMWGGDQKPWFIEGLTG